MKPGYRSLGRLVVAANMLEIIGLVALSILDAEAIEWLLIARSHPGTHANREHIFFFSSFVEHRRRDNHRRNSGKFCSWMQVGIYYRIYFGLSTPPRPGTCFVLPLSLICIPLSVPLRKSRYSKWVPAIACCAPSSTTSHASFYWNIIFPFTNGLSEIAGKFFTSGRHESYNSTFQRGPPFGSVVVTRTRNNARLREEKVFSALHRDFANATPIAGRWTRIRENFVSIVFDRKKNS